MADAFDFTIHKDFTQEDFNRTVINGPGGIREVVGGILGGDPGTFLGVQLFMTKEGQFTSSRWVGCGPLDGDGTITFKAASLFPAAPPTLHLKLRVTLDMFEWPGDASNFSAYVDFPGAGPVAAFTKSKEEKSALVDWEVAKGQGVGDFAVRAIVMPHSTSQVFVHVGAVPFSVAHMKARYSEVFTEAFFPNFLLSVTKAPTKLPEGHVNKTSRLVKMVDLQLQDVEGFGLGVLPFFNVLRFHPREEPITMPSFDLVRRTLFTFMKAGRHPVSKTAAAFPGALAVALEADANPANLLPSVSTVWPALNTPQMMADAFGGGCFACYPG